MPPMAADPQDYRPPQESYDVMTLRTYAFGAAMVLLGALGVYLMMAKPEVNPLFTVFFYSIPANCAIALFPHEPVLIFYGKTVGLVPLSIAATLGTLLAAYLDYRFFSPLLNLQMTATKYRDRPLYQKARRWFYRFPFITLVIVGFTPIPFYPFKFMVYASKYSTPRYLAAMAVGRLPRYYLLGYLGYTLKIPNWIIIGSFVALVFMIYHRKVWNLLRRPFRAKAPATDGGEMSTGMSGMMLTRTALRTARNLLLRRPLCVSFEITHNCTANCRHCDKGAKVDDHPLTAEEYGRICKDLNPTLVQIAGGEPLLRDDLADIVRALHRPNHPPVIAVVTNGSLLTKDRYLELREAGVHQFSISIDFPDARHDSFRRVPGLFEHLERTIPELLAMGHGDVVLNSCIHRENYPYLLDITRMARRWGAKLNFSAYTELRTHNPELNLRHPEDTEELNGMIDQLYSGNGEFGNVMTSERVMRRYCRFFETRHVPNCQAGYRFLVVNPDGGITPCAMHIDERYRTREELIEKFTRRSKCGGCYISSRANTEKSVWELLSDNLRFLRLSRRGAAK